MIPQSTINACVKVWYGTMEDTDYGKIQAVLMAYDSLRCASPSSDGGHVRRMVGKLAQWQHCMSYNDSYFGEPAGLVKQVVAELARAVDPIYPAMPEPVNPFAEVVIHTATESFTPNADGTRPAESVAQGGEVGVGYGIIDPDYARIFTIARTLCWSEGYALTMHGSFTRDLDLVAVPWTDRAREPEHLARRVLETCGLKDTHSNPGEKPHGRLVWTMRLPDFGDPRFVDFSIIPPTPTPATGSGGDEGLLNLIDLIRTGRDGTKYDYVITRSNSMVNVAQLFAHPAPAGGDAGEAA